jgi:hypothetical protein
MRLVYHREPQEVAFQFFWVNEQNQRTSPIFYTEDEAKQWLIKSVATITEEPKPPVTEKPDIINKAYTDAYNAGKLFAELEYIELKQNILELIADAKPTKILEQIKTLLK